MWLFAKVGLYLRVNKKNMKQTLNWAKWSTAVLLLALAAACAGPKPLNTGNFVKPATNPILKADSTLVFTCPIKKTTVQWQKADVFNPAAVVKDGKICLLYRCEDNPAAALGGRTSASKQVH
jgi:beta-1,2-mannosidase